MTPSKPGSLVLGPVFHWLLVLPCGDLRAQGLPSLVNKFGDEKASLLHRMATGQYEEPVKDRAENQSLAAGKTFFGKQRLTCMEQVEHHLSNFAQELWLRLVAHRQSYHKVPTKLVVGFSDRGAVAGQQNPSNVSKQTKISIGRGGSADVLIEAGKKVARQLYSGRPVLATTLSMTLGEFEKLETGHKGMASWLSSQPKGVCTWLCECLFAFEIVSVNVLAWQTRKYAYACVHTHPQTRGR